MTDIVVKGDYEGVGGGFAVRTSFPVTLRPCETHIDKIKLKKEFIYVEHHGEAQGPVSTSLTRIKKE